MTYTHTYTGTSRPSTYTTPTRTARKVPPLGEMTYTPTYTPYTRPELHVPGGFYREPPERSQVVRPVNEGVSR